ncbi:MULTISPECIES: regulatory protein GemA [Rodentibacter]|uniref:regulatory protein GemA n=1 Tax=Rodentibacter TaxID=1960084 RepID=UPI0010944EBA|nr:MULTISPECIES: regulatory protein GemA [Pasteurellaceae]MCR1838334.1 regulatory protein GemA [Pasteurella caecimuris]MCU0107555.1 regulatory protein GemA [Pasteurella caecimuris]NBH76240.1 regulatory protein GemA [Rodentibacter pneumotropicus]TGY49616.1 regulatory protein GemA [Pasteurella caecimuris]THA07151.1 regulatory protein GemA [Rodentibacter pneumotropicus]
MRRRLLQLVHIGKNQLKMDDETYRSLLSQQFYQNSAKNISYSELVKLVKILQQKGAKIRLPRNTQQLSAIQRKLWAVWKAVADESTSAALNAYVKRYYADMTDWRDLNNEQTTSIIEQLKQWKKRVGK